MPKIPEAAAEPVPESKKKRARGPNTRLTREDWIAAAMDALIKKSIDGVHVEVLAEQLGITKGSFYSHFSSRQQLLDAVLASWESTTTANVIARLDSGVKDAALRLRALYRLSHLKTPDTPGGPLELAIRAWSRRDQAVRKVLQAVDKARVHYIATLFEQIGYEPFEARARAVLYYGYVAGRNILVQSGEAESPLVYTAVEELVLGAMLQGSAEAGKKAAPARAPARKRTAKSA
jgi:AcrR family transcriptional regulator